MPGSRDDVEMLDLIDVLTSDCGSFGPHWIICHGSRISILQHVGAIIHDFHRFALGFRKYGCLHRRVGGTKTQLRIVLQFSMPLDVDPTAYRALVFVCGRLTRSISLYQNCI